MRARARGARTLRLLGCTALCLAFGAACDDPPPQDPQEALIPTVSVDTAPWVVDARGIVEESAPGSGIFLLEPGGFRARLPDELRRHGLRVVFSGRPQPPPPGWRPPGQPFMLTSIRREQSQLDVFLDLLRGRADAPEESGPPFMR